MVPHNAFMTGDELTVSQNLSRGERESQLKTKVLTFMENNLDKLRGEIVLYHDSDPVLYDPGRPWTYDEQTTVQQGGEMVTETTLDRTLGATPLLTR